MIQGVVAQTRRELGIALWRTLYIAIEAGKLTLRKQGFSVRLPQNGKDYFIQDIDSNKKIQKM
jgi:hypothetical protein